MTRGLILVLILAGLLFAGITSAQTGGGQLCIRAFEDRNGNGQDDGGEPRITKGLSATLANADGVVIASTVMEDSLNAATGTLCFQRLAAGQYAVGVASADYAATTETEFITAIPAAGLQIFEFGGQPIVSELPLSGDAGLNPDAQRTLILRLVFGVIGAAIVVGAMALVGVLIYALFLRAKPASAYATATHSIVPPGTGGMEPVIMPDDTDKSAPLVFDDEDTDRSRPITPVDEGAEEFQFTEEDNGDPDRPFKPPEEA